MSPQWDRPVTRRGGNAASCLPVSFSMLLTGETFVPSWGPEGKVLWLCLGLSCFLMTRSDEMFAADLGMVHGVHYQTRGDVAFDAQSTQLDSDR